MIKTDESGAHAVASRPPSSADAILDHHQPCALCPDGFHISAPEWNPYAADPEQIDDH